MSETINIKVPCEECHRIKPIINHCVKHDAYYCNKCACYECSDIQTQILLTERQIDRKQSELSYYYVELNHLKKQINSP